MCQTELEESKILLPSWIYLLVRLGRVTGLVKAGEAKWVYGKNREEYRVGTKRVGEPKQQTATTLKQKQKHTESWGKIKKKKDP